MPFEKIPAQPLPESPFRHAPLLRFALLAVMGILLGWYTKEWFPVWGSLGTAIVLAVAATVIYLLAGTKEKGRKTVWWVGMASVMLLFASLLQGAYDRVVVQWPELPQTWNGQVVRVHKIKTQSVALDVRLHAPHLAWHNRVVRVTLAHNDAHRLGLHITEGRCMAFYGKMQSGKRSASNPGDFDYAHYLLTHGLSGSCYVWRGKCELLGDDAQASISWQSRLLRWRHKLSAAYEPYFDKGQQSLLAALTLGDKTMLDEDTRQLFSNLGVSHVLALSGLHLGILLSLFNMLCLRHLRRTHLRIIASIFIVFAMWAFTFLTGAPLSLLRAVCMFTCMQISICLQRSSASTLNSLSLAAIILLLADPMSLFDVGFQLSFMAVAGIVFVGRYVWQRYPLSLYNVGTMLQVYQQPRPKGMSYATYAKQYCLPWLRLQSTKVCWKFFRHILVPFVCVSLSAQWATAPLVLYYFHTLSPYAWLANFVVIPSAYVLLGGALLFFALPFAVVQHVLASIMSCTINAMTSALTSMQVWPFSTLTFYPTPYTLLAIWLVPVLVYAFAAARRRRLRLRVLCSVFLVLTLSVVTEVYRVGTDKRVSPQIWVYANKQATLVHFIVSAQESYLVSTLPPQAISKMVGQLNRNYWQPHHIAPPKQIVNSDARTKFFLKKGNSCLFGSKRIMLCATSVVLTCSRPANPYPLDLLIVSRGCIDSFEAMQSYFTPGQVVLASSLPSWQRSAWRTACQRAGVPCHDVAESGAYNFVVR